jgi:DNA-directed RNA polymerase subunit RPC12/RpoP
MTGKKINSGESNVRSVLPSLKRYIQATSAMFALVGLLMPLIALDEIPPLRQQDALFGLTTRTVLALVGVLHLVLSGYLFVGRDLMTQGIVVFWAGLNHMVYALGMVWLRAAAPFPAVVAVAWKLGLSSRVADVCWKLFTAYLLLGSLLILMLEWRRLKRLRIEMFWKRWGEVRARGVAKGDSLIRNATKTEVVGKSLSEFKFSCPSCGQHIRCDEVYSGRQINCPSCKNWIVVTPTNARQSEA